LKKGIEMNSLQEAVKRLVLTRRVGESIDFDGIIRITVQHVSGGQTKLLIEAPEDIHVLRTELANCERRTA
jgi:carbon storage regulator CsrA